MTRAQIVDEFCLLDAEVKAFKPKQERHEALKKTIRDWFENQAAEGTFLEAGVTGAVAVGEKANETHISNKPKLIKLLTAARFREIATVTLKALSEHLSPIELATVTVKARTGTRPLKAMVRA